MKYFIKKLINNSLFYIYPHFSIRYFLSRDIGYIVKHYKPHGKLLDVGCGEKPYKSIFQNTDYFGIDHKRYSRYKGKNTDQKPDKYFDDKYTRDGILPFANNLYDVVCSFQVLEHVKNPSKLLKEMTRVLKPKGYMILTVPFIWGLHEEPKDYYRYTEYGIRSMIVKNKCKLIMIKKQGGVLSVIENSLMNYLVELNKKNFYYYLLTIPMYIPILLLSYVSVFIEHFVSSKTVFSNYLFLIQKTR